MEKAPLTETKQAKEKIRVSKQALNRKITLLEMGDHKLILALERKRTEVSFGCAHYCYTH